MFKSFKEMPIWKEAMNIAEEIFFLTNNLPKKEDYGFTSQIRRSALSISSNIAEAYGRNHILDKKNFYYFSRGSIMETQNHIEYGNRVGYIKKNKFDNLDKRLSELYRDINKLIVSLRGRKKFSQPKPKP
ncbi:MAG: four helix bundle protein [Candidatus Omnitrophica bacterium]|nr:four helix bundle protein [Candidatus Omnitrophota bacterium]